MRVTTCFAEAFFFGAGLFLAAAFPVAGAFFAFFAIFAARFFAAMERG